MRVSGYHERPLSHLGALLAILSLAGASFAQVESESGGELEEIVVTGTRIANENLGSSVPVANVDAEYIELSGETILTDLLQEMPALVGSDSGNMVGDAGAGDGTAALNLRNLGEQRTLVLVNGRRHVASRAGTAVVDINSIPTALVERVDVLTGGASAIYGADGVSGVVNFVLRDDFEGLELSVQSNLPDDSGGDNYLASATFGRNFADGRGNVALNVEYFRQNRLLNIQRGLTPGLPESLTINPADDTGVDDPNIPDRILVADQRLPLTSREGVLFTGDFSFDFFIPDYTGDGRVFDTAILLSDGNQIGGDGLPDLNPVTAAIISDEERYNLNLLSNYDFTDRLNGYFEFKYIDAEIEREFGGAKTIDDSIAISHENPFIPSTVPLVPWVPDNGIGTPLNILTLGRDNFDLGTNSVFDSRSLYRAVAGLRGDFSDNISFDVSYVYGRVETDLLEPNSRIEDRFFAALDVVTDPATGMPVCRSNLDPSSRPFNIHDVDPDAADYLGVFNSDGDPTYSFFSSYNIDTFGDPGAPSTTFTPGPNSGCAPLNLFGYQQASPEAIAFVTAPTTNKAELTQQVFSAVLSGDTESIFTLPAGPLGFAFGLEYREEESRFTPDELNLRGATFEPTLPATTGEFDVTEVFGELAIPILSDKPLFQNLTVGAAARYSDYSTSGSNTTSRGNLSWSPVDDVTLRGSVSRAIRAPNINELFQPTANTFFEPTDPCLPQQLGLGSSTRVANCTEALAAVGIDLANFVIPPSGPFLGKSGGNPNLAEEVSDSFTYGVVLTPSFIPGLSLSIDFWDIEISDAILETNIQDIINTCYDSPDLNNQFCALLSRSPVTGHINDGQTSFVNIAFFESSGVDIEARYRFDVTDLFNASSDLGEARLRVIGTRVDSLNVVPVPDGGTDDELGELTTFLGGAAPEDVLNLNLTWFGENLSVNYQYRYESSLLRLEKADLANKPDTLFPFDTRSRERHDFGFGYEFNESFSIFGGVNNFTKPGREIGFIRDDRVFFLRATYSNAGFLN